MKIYTYIGITMFCIALVSVGYYSIERNADLKIPEPTTARMVPSQEGTTTTTASTTASQSEGKSVATEDSNTIMNKNSTVKATSTGAAAVVEKRKALLAGGCFWCVESDLQKYTGVIDVVSGYAGGRGENPTYKDYAERGFREVVEVTYDPRKVSYGNLVEYVIRHSDATDPNGSFNDRGIEYTSAAYYRTPAEKLAAEKVVATLSERKIYEKPLALYIEPIEKFWPAEEYHQDYSIKNTLKYSYYRSASGRDAFIKKHWGVDTVPTPTPDVVISNNTQMNTISSTEKNFWLTFVKPSREALQSMLTPLQYTVTQEEGTESSFKNEYNKNIDPGIYVDIVSGEPLYSSKDKYDSGTGWPSFVKPISPTAVSEKVDKGIFTTRVEIRSTIADSHLGHVFDDGPQDRGGKRYCMNSAAMKFIPKMDMERLGYGEYLQFVD